MTKPDRMPRLHELRDLEFTLREHRSSCRTDLRSRMMWAWLRLRRLARQRPVRKAAMVAGGVVGVLLLAFCGMWLRLAAGPIELNFLSPWLAAAVEQTIGTNHKVAIAGTQIERDEAGRTAIRILNMQVRDADGTVVASAPKAEVSVSGMGLLRGQVRARRVSLVGAELSVRIEEDGQVTISTGGEKRPLAVTPAIVRAAPSGQPGVSAPAATPPGTSQSAQPTAPQPGAIASSGAGSDPSGADRFVALMAWIDRISTLGLDGQGLGEVGLKDGVLRVDDLRTDKHWTFERINFSVVKPGDGIAVRLSSEDTERPWKLIASVRQSGFQRKLIRIDLTRVNTKDLFLATRLGDGQFQADVPISGTIRAEIGPDSLPKTVEGKLVADAGLIGDPNDPGGHMQLDYADFTLDWDQSRRSLTMPFQIQSGANRITLFSRFEAPGLPGEPWRATVTGGSVVLSEGPNDPQPVVLNKVLLRANLDFNRRKLELVQGDIGGGGVSGYLNGGVDFSSGEPRLAVGFALTPMSSAMAKKVWPVFIATKVRNWVADNLVSGDIERVDIATNAPIDTLKEGGPPIPADGLSIDVMVRNATVRPVVGMPPITEADLRTTIKGRNVVVQVGRGVVDLGGGRKLTVSNGRFEVPDTHPKSPPARAQFRLDGPVPAALELLQSERIRGQAAIPMDSANSRGNLGGTVTVNLPITANPAPGATQYQIVLDVAGFAADKMVMGQKIEAQALKVTANNLGYQIKGDVRINGTPASLDYSKLADAAEAEVRVHTTLDEAARARFGFATGPALSGAVPIRIAGKIADNKDVRLQVEADLTPARIDNLLPGWNKPPGRSTRASFTMVSRDKATRFENLAIDGSGVNVRGTIELDAAGDLVNASFPVFALSDGDKTSLRAERGTDGTLKVSMRGDVYDGRGFVKAFFGGEPQEKSKNDVTDVDVDIRLGAIAGHNGEALRGVDLKMTRRNGQIRTFSLNSKLGREASLTGEIRSGGQRKNVLYFETVDAGALMRFTDIYPRLHGGQLWVAMDVPTPDQAPQDGIINLRDFTIKGEAALNTVVGIQPGENRGVDFTRLKVDFTRTPGKLLIKEGEVRGPTVGATVDGNVDFVKNDVRLRGTFVPLYGINNAFGQIPLVGLFLGGQKEGLLGITYEVSGPPSAPKLRVNPISAVAPGLLRKFFEFPTTKPQEPFDAGANNTGPATLNVR
jgi:hypothetical protein